MKTTQSKLKKVRILVNRRSGFIWSFKKVQQAFDEYWDTPEHDLSYQFCKDSEDGRIKALRAVEQGVDVLLVVGGDGTISTTGATLIGTQTVLGAIPMGSGNGFARHFGIPLKPEEAALDLATAEVKAIDVGCVGGRPFFATCSMAWDAAIVRSFQKSPVRGILPYVFAGVYEFLDYKPQPTRAQLDTGEILEFPDPLVFTIANLTQYGANVHIAADAEPDDGLLELVVARKQDTPTLIKNLFSLKTRALAELPRIEYRRFRRLRVERKQPGLIQVDGELVDAPAMVDIEVKPQSLRVLVPRKID